MAHHESMACSARAGTTGRSIGRALALGVAALALAACTGANLDAGLIGTGLAPATTVAAATPEDAVLPPAAVPDAGDAVAAANAGAQDTASQTGESVPDAAAAIAAVAAPPSLAAPSALATTTATAQTTPLPPASVPSTARSAATARETKPFRLLALAPTETRREKRDAFRARAERANLVAPRAERAAPTERRTRIIRPRKASENAGGLPGVRPRSSIFQFGKPKANDGARSFRVASAAGLARLSGSGLRKQTAHVKTECFKPGLVAALRQAERHFGKPAIVTSGYRSPKGNSRAGGARGSKHISCEAADFQIEGVSKWTLAKYLRSLPDRGGVGTYCHTKSVHYDIGSTRDWNWGCRKKRR